MAYDENPITLKRQGGGAAYLEDECMFLTFLSDGNMHTYAARNGKKYELRFIMPMPPNPLVEYLAEERERPEKSKMKIATPETIDGDILAKGRGCILVKEHCWMYSLRSKK